MPSRVPVFDAFYKRRCTATASEAKVLIEHGAAVLRTRRKIHGLLITDDLDYLLETPIAGKSGAGMPHARETITNPAGCMTFDFISSDLRPDFERVIRDVLR